MVIFAENDSCQFGKPWIQFSVTREECLPGALEYDRPEEKDA